MLTYIQIKLSGVGLGFASFLGGVGIGAGAASKKTQINLKIKKKSHNNVQARFHLSNNCSMV